MNRLFQKTRFRFIKNIYHWQIKNLPAQKAIVKSEESIYTEDFCYIANYKSCELYYSLNPYCYIKRDTDLFCLLFSELQNTDFKEPLYITFYVKNLNETNDLYKIRIRESNGS